MRKSTLIKHLESLSQEELQSEVLTLFDKFSEVKNHYKLDLGSAEDRAKIYKQAKVDIAKCFKTKSYVRPRRPRIKIMNSVLKKMEKSVLFEHDMIDIRLHAAESASTFMIEYEYLSDTLFNAVLKNLEHALGLIHRSKLESEFLQRVQNLIVQLREFYWISDKVWEMYTKVYDECDF